MVHAASSLSVVLLIRKWSLRGGNERVAAELARALRAAGHHVEVHCQKVDPSAAAVLAPHALHPHRGPSFDPTLAMLSFAWSGARLVEALRRAGQGHVVLGFNHTVAQDVFRLGGGTHAELLALARRSPRGRALRAGPVVDRVALHLERLRFEPGRFRTLVAPSRQVRAELLEHYAVPAERVEVIPNGVDRDRFRPWRSSGEQGAADRRRLRAEWGLPERAPAALFVGHELERKGFTAAVEASARARASLVYVGRGSRPRALPAHVRWVGERADVERCYRAADALVLPSRYEPFGGVVLEALASGLPAVATRRVGATERMVGTPLEALLVEDPDDVSRLAERLRAALDPPQAERWAELARGATEGAELARWAAAMEDVLRAAAGPEGRPGARPSYPSARGPC